MQIGNFIFIRDVIEENLMIRKGWKLKPTDRVYRMSHNMLYFGPRWKLCRSKWDVAVFFLQSFSFYVKANILHLLEAGQGLRHNQEPGRCVKKNGSKDIER